MFARMQAITPAYSTYCTLYDTAPQIIRSCELYASTDAFVSRDKQCPCTYSYWYIYQYVISSTEPREQAICTAAAQTSEILSFRKKCPCTYTHTSPYRASSASSIHSSRSANIRNVGSTSGIRSIVLPCSPRSVNRTGTRDFTDTYCLNTTVSATSCVVSTKDSIFLVLIRAVSV